MQNAILAGAFRVLGPDGVLIGSDSLPGNDLHHFHADDTYNPVDPASIVSRLQTLGFATITVMVDYMLRFIATKPEPQQTLPATGDPPTGAAAGRRPPAAPPPSPAFSAPPSLRSRA